MSIDDEQIKKLKEEMLDVLVLANQSGKKETSEIVNDIMRRIKTEIQSTVDKSIAENPSMVILAKMQNAASVGAWLLQTIILIGAAVAVFNWHNINKLFNQQ